MIGDMADSLFNGGGNKGVESNSNVDSGLAAIDDVPSWSSLRSNLESKQTTDEEKNFRANLVKGYGVGSPLNKIRLYDDSNKEEDIKVTFYRDSASWCKYNYKMIRGCRRGESLASTYK